MDMFTIIAIIVAACVVGVGIGMVGADRLIAWVRKQRKAVNKRRRKQKAAWLTWKQCSVLDSIAKHGSRGVLLWYTDISLSTIRSLAKRGFVDTRSGNRIVATRAGKRRVLEPWPARLAADAPKVVPHPSASGQAQVAPAASEGAGSVGKTEQTG